MKSKAKSWKAVVVGAAVVGVAGGCHGARTSSDPPTSSNVAPPLRPLCLDHPLDRLAAERPLDFLRQCRDHCAKTVGDYTCRFRMRERVDEAKPAMGPLQEIDIRFRESPYSVDMRWIQNAIHATRVNFVKGRWRRGERELALIVPAGLLNLVAPAGVRLDIRATELHKASSRSIDEFGFKRTLESIIARCEQAGDDPKFSLRAAGVGIFDGRDCLVFERRLPYDGPGGPYPDRLLVMYIDREWLVPLACHAYADDEGIAPIGTYETTDVRLNVGLGDGDF